MDYEAIAKEIEQNAFDRWTMNKEEKQYMGAFDLAECVNILRTHFPEPQPAKELAEQVYEYVNSKVYAWMDDPETWAHKRDQIVDWVAFKFASLLAQPAEDKE